MTDMSGYMNSTEQEFASVTANISEVQQTLLLVNKSIGIMPALDNSVRNMDASLAGLNTDLHAMVRQIRHINGNVAGMTNSVQVLNKQIDNMNLNKGNLAGSMRQLSKPMKAFPI